MEAPYTPISCSFYDHLEAYATRRWPVTILYQQPGQPRVQEVIGIITDFFMKEKAEYMRLDNGQEIRLDWLKQVENHKLSSGLYC